MYCGVDLAYKRPSSLAVFDGRKGFVLNLKNYELPGLLGLCRIIAVDAPLTLKHGYRDFERELVAKGLRVFPPSFLKNLVLAFQDLAREIDAEVVETHPGTSKKLSNLRVIPSGKITKDELDAIVSSMTAYLHARGKDYEVKGNEGELHVLNSINACITYKSPNFFLTLFSFGLP